MKKIAKFSLLALLLIPSHILLAQKISPEQYIERYKEIAIRHRFEYNIPASITLAQGFLESGYGNSRLSLEANNHFGIKCHSDWKGKRIYEDDDAKDECFRVYASPEESYEDHAIFLSTRSRYAFLFSYKVTDYKSWAKGLKKAGYATNPKYPSKLIDLVERYKLDQYDRISREEFDASLTPQLSSQQVQSIDSVATQSLEQKPVVAQTNIRQEPHQVQYYNRIKYITIREGESIVDIARLFDIMPNQLYKYNDMTKGTELKAGMILYLQPKRNRGGQKFHSVKAGQDLWDVSQIYGIKMKHLRRLNNLTEDAEIKTGQRLNLRKVK